MIRTGSKIKYFIIVMGVVLSSTAPFLHILFPKQDAQQIQLESAYQANTITEAEYNVSKKILKDRYFHFGTVRSFLIAIGNPSTMLFSAFIMLMSISYINQKEMKRIVVISGMILFSISNYWLIWTFWPRNDLPKLAYHTSIVIGAIASSFLSYHLIINESRVHRYLGVIRKLTTFIIIDIREKYVHKEDKKEYTKDITSLTDKF